MSRDDMELLFTNVLLACQLCLGLWQFCKLTPVGALIQGVIGWLLRPLGVSETYSRLQHCPGRVFKRANCFALQADIPSEKRDIIPSERRDIVSCEVNTIKLQYLGREYVLERKGEDINMLYIDQELCYYITHKIWKELQNLEQVLRYGLEGPPLARAVVTTAAANRVEAHAERAEADARSAEPIAERAESMARDAGAEAERAKAALAKAEAEAEHAEAEAERAKGEHGKAEAEAERAKAEHGKAEAEAEREGAEAEAQRAKAGHWKAEAEAQRAKAEHRKAKAEAERAEAEAERAKPEHEKAEAEAERAEAEAERAKAEDGKIEAEVEAERAEAEDERLKAEHGKTEAEAEGAEAEAERAKAEHGKTEAEVEAERAEAEDEREKAEDGKTEAEAEGAEAEAERAKAEHGKAKVKRADAERRKAEDKAKTKLAEAELAKAEAEAEHANAKYWKAEDEAKAKAEAMAEAKAKAMAIARAEAMAKAMVMAKTDAYSNVMASEAMGEAIAEAETETMAKAKAQAQADAKAKSKSKAALADVAGSIARSAATRADEAMRAAKSYRAAADNASLAARAATDSAADKAALAAAARARISTLPAAAADARAAADAARSAAAARTATDTADTTLFVKGKKEFWKEVITGGVMTFKEVSDAIILYNQHVSRRLSNDWLLPVNLSVSEEKLLKIFNLVALFLQTKKANVHWLIPTALSFMTALLEFSTGLRVWFYTKINELFCIIMHFICDPLPRSWRRQVYSLGKWVDNLAPSNDLLVKVVRGNMCAIISEGAKVQKEGAILVPWLETDLTPDYGVIEKQFRCNTIDIYIIIRCSYVIDHELCEISAPTICVFYVKCKSIEDFRRIVTLVSCVAENCCGSLICYGPNNKVCIRGFEESVTSYVNNELPPIYELELMDVVVAGGGASNY